MASKTVTKIFVLSVQGL